MAAGTPLTLIGPAATGKTWLAEHLLDEVRQRPGARVARVNLRHMSSEERQSFLAFSGLLLRVLGKVLDLRDEADQLAADHKLTPMLRITELLEAALRATDGVVHLILDVPDEVLSWNRWVEVDRMLRS